jgi:hypothetical protein
MNTMQGKPLLACLLSGIGLATASLPLMANIEMECRAEAEEYGVPPEQMEDYISGCVMSRGGAAPEASLEDYTPPAEDAGESAEAGETGEAGEADGDVPQ